MVTGWSGRRGSKPRYLYAPATHVLPLDIGSEPPRARTDRSGDSDSSVLPPYFVRRHFKGACPSVEASCGTRQRLQIVPGDEPGEGITCLRHDIPINAWTSAPGTGVEDVEPARRKPERLLCDRDISRGRKRQQTRCDQPHHFRFPPTPCRSHDARQHEAAPSAGRSWRGTPPLTALSSNTATTSQAVWRRLAKRRLCRLAIGHPSSPL